MASSFMQSANNAGKLWTGQHMSISTILYSSQYYWDMTYDPVVKKVCKLDKSTGCRFPITCRTSRAKPQPPHIRVNICCY